MAYVGFISEKDKQQKTRVKKRSTPGSIFKGFMFLLSERNRSIQKPHPPVIYKTDNINKFLFLGLWIILG
jgi:hypothetical protein